MPLIRFNNMLKYLKKNTLRSALVLMAFGMLVSCGPERMIGAYYVKHSQKGTILVMRPDLVYKSNQLRSDLSDQMILFGGSYQLIRGGTPPRNIKRGAFDPYTGRLSWSISWDNKLIYGTGLLDWTNQDAGNMHLFWPPHPVSGVVSHDYVYELFSRK